MIIYLLVGTILGLVVTIYDALRSSPAKRIRTLIEMLVVTLTGTIVVSLLLPAGIFAAASTAVVFALINQIPKWFYGTLPGQIVREIIVDTPAYFLGALTTGFAWYYAVSAVAILVAPEPIAGQDLQSIAMMMFAFTEGTVIFSMVKGDIENLMYRDQLR